MVTKMVEVAPKCNFCEKLAKYDAPIDGCGCWAYMCEDCRDTQGVENWQIKMGTTFVMRPQQPATSKFVRGQEPGLEDIEYWEGVMMGERYIDCPECGESRAVEPDARYTYLCGCGVNIQVPEGLF